MKFLFMTDIHARSTNPRARKDNLLETMFLKLDEVRQLGIEHGVTAYLFGGDLTDKPDTPYSVTGALIRSLMQFPAPIYGVAGNTHDIWGDNILTVQRTALDVVQAAGCIDLIEPGKARMFEGKGFTVQVTGQHYHKEMDRRDFRMDYCVTRDPESPDRMHYRTGDVRWAIHIVHGMLTAEPLMEAIHHTLVEDVLANTMADITLSGHEHKGYGVVEAHGRTACNPGALVRLFADRKEMERTVQVALITLTADSCKVELIPLQSARPGDEVLDRSHIDTANAKNMAMERFIADVHQGGDFEALDIPSIIERMAANKGVPAAVLQEAIERVHVATEELSAREVAV